MKELKEIILSQDIVMIDIRYINHNGDWNSISYLSNHFNELFFKNYIYIDDIVLNPLNKNRYFIDHFLSHKTLVFLTDIQSNIIKCDKNTKNFFYDLDFYIENDNDNENEVNIDNKYLSPILDKFRDFRGEIIASLLDFKVDIVKHYHSDLPNKHTIVISKNKDSFVNLDSIQKVKYAILMTANAYNIKINTKKGIFLDYKQIYKLI